MINNIFIILNISVAQKINGFLYFLRIKNFSFLGFKRFVSAISLLYKMISEPIKIGLVFGLLIYLPMSLGGQGQDALSGVMFLMFTFHFIFTALRSELLDISNEKFLLVKQMKMDPKVYCVSTIISDKVIDLLSRSMVLMLAFKMLLRQSLVAGFQIAISIVMFSITVEFAYLYIFNKTGFNPNKATALRIIVTILGVVGAYVFALFTAVPSYLNLFEILTSPITTIVFIATGILGLTYIVKYDHYWDVVNEGNTLSAFQQRDEDQKDIYFAQVKLQDQDFDEEALRENDASKRAGYDYLNHIFFQRHKRLVYKPMLIKSSIIFGVFLLIFIGNTFFIDTLGQDVASLIIDGYSMFMIIMYIICNSEAIIKSLFYNCDRSLLRYGFYKRGDDLLKMFFLRFRRILFTNMVPTLVLSLGILQVFYFYASTRIGEVVPIVGSIIILAITFSIHYIFMYYIFQPFTTSLEMKNPFYGILNWLVYMISYFFMQLRMPASQILPFIFIFSCVYIVLATVLVYKKAPITFRVK